MSLDSGRQPAASDATAPAIGGKWRLRFWSIWLGQALSLVGSALTQFVVLWWITQTTGSAGALATAGVMALLPQALLGPLGGIVADRLRRRTIMVAADAVSAVCMVVIIWLFASGTVQLWHVYGLMFIRSSMQAFQTPAAAASTAMLVPTEWLPRAAGLNQMLQGIMTVAAAPLGALALAFLPLHGALTIDVVTALLAIVPLLCFAIPQPHRDHDRRMGLVADFREGLSTVVRNRGLLLLYGVLGLVVLTIMPTFTLTPLLVKQHFGGGVNEVAVMEGLSGVGIILGGVLMSAVSLRARKVMLVLLSFAVSCGTVALTALAPSGMLWLATVWWFVSGATFSTGNAPMMALIQTIVPNQVQGRAIGLLNTLIGVAGPAGLALAALLGSVVSVRGLFILGGTLAAAICVLGFASRRLRELETAQAALPDSDARVAEHRQE